MLEPLRVTVDLEGPISVGMHAITLDGVLAACAVEEALAGADENDQTELAVLGDNLPLGKVLAGETWFWQASAFLPAGRVRDDGSLDMTSGAGRASCRRLVRRTDADAIAREMERSVVRTRGFDPDAFKPYALQIDASSGIFKGALMVYMLKDVQRVEAWCIGDKAMVGELLQEHLSHLGPRKRLGHGKVVAVRVEDDARALTLWRMRPLPAASCSTDELGSREPTLGGVRPPYWRADRQALVMTPLACIW